MSARQEIESDCEYIANEVKAFKRAVHTLTQLHDQMMNPLATAEMSLRAMTSKGIIAKDATLVEKIAKLSDLVQRVRELKNTMDIATLVIRTDRVMDEVWQSLP